jgi:hypothetical protein
MTLPKEDLNLIAQIDARLKHYNLIQPIDTTEGEPIETEQRWKPKHGEEVYAANNNPLKFIFTNQAWHLVMYEAGLLFKTKEEAIRHYVFMLIVNSKKQAIKQYLSANKF